MFKYNTMLCIVLLFCISFTRINAAEQNSTNLDNVMKQMTEFLNKSDFKQISSDSFKEAIGKVQNSYNNIVDEMLAIAKKHEYSEWATMKNDTMKEIYCINDFNEFQRSNKKLLGKFAVEAYQHVAWANNYAKIVKDEVEVFNEGIDQLRLSVHFCMENNSCVIEGNNNIVEALHEMTLRSEKLKNVFRNIENKTYELNSIHITDSFEKKLIMGAAELKKCFNEV